MLDWLPEASHHKSDPTLGHLGGTLVLAFFLGWVVAGVYFLTQRKYRTDLSSLATTLVLLTVLIAMVTLVIGNNIARAFSLVGALAIVRFRTVVEDTRDTAFVMFSVIVGMGVGSGGEGLLVSLVGIPVVAAAAWLANLLPSTPSAAGREFSLTIRLGIGHDPQALLQGLFSKHLAQVRLRSTETGRQGSALDLSYLVRFRTPDSEIAFVAELNRVEGVQNVELRSM